MPNSNNLAQPRFPSSLQIFTNKQIGVLVSKNAVQNVSNSTTHKNLLKNKQNQLVTVPIKEYSNKFLRQRRKEQQQGSIKKKQPFPNSHLHNNRKLISEFKRYKGKSQKFKKSINNQNAGDFIIYNLLFQKEDHLNTNTSNKVQRKTIFGTFTQNSSGYPHRSTNEQSSLFEKGWTTSKNDNLFQAKKQIYEKICQKQKTLIPEYRKKCKTFGDVSNYENNDFDKDKKFEKISTSRALEKYSKIIKVNPQHGKIQKMKIKKDLAKSLRFQSSQKSEIQTKQITLSRKQFHNKNRSTFMSHEKQNFKIYHHSIDHNNTNSQSHQMMRTPQKLRTQNEKQNFITSKVGMFTSGLKFKRFRKFSHQVQMGKKCMTEQKALHQADQTFDDFQINGWDINF